VDPEPDPRDHWAFRPVVRPPVPVIEGAWGQHPIDALVARQHGDHGIVAQPEAPAEVLQRRLSFDLIGLPPEGGMEESAGSRPADDWYEAEVNRLLADARHGERWARHWMDIWRYSDWWGLGDQLRNSQKHMWRWRDWMVEAINADFSYAEMIRLMLAADERHPGDPSRLRATGFLARNYFLFNRNQWMEETVEHVGKALLGLTLNCAKCHDHKYDPIDQKDYYRMRAFFEPYHVRLDMVPGGMDFERDGLPRIYDGWLDEPTWRFVRGEESRPDKSAPVQPGVPSLLVVQPLKIEPVALPPVAYEPERQPWVLEAHVAAARRAVAAAGEARSTAAAAVEPAGAEVESAKAKLHVADLGVAAAEARAREVEARAAALRARWAEAPEAAELKVVAVHADREAAAAAARHRVAEKEWEVQQSPQEKREEAEKALAAARESLARAEGALAEPVSAEAVLPPMPGARWSATRFRNSTADDPDVPFPTRSTGRRSALADWIADAQNPLTARVAVNHVWTRHMGAPLVATAFDFGRKGAKPTHPELLDWLAAEFMENGWSLKHLHRLIVTSRTYRLSSSMAGGQAAAAIDPDNRHLWRRLPQRLEAETIRDAILAHAGELDTTIGGPTVPPADQETSRRRSLYFFHSNNDRNLFLTTFDGPAVKECYRREQSVVPQQALALSNSRLVQEAAHTIASRFSKPGLGDTGGDVDEARFIERAWFDLLGIRPSVEEVAASRGALERWRELEAADAGVARAHLIWSLLNHNDFVTLR
ncbi:MAG: DUF1549 and DUF1553 domain-containing protein, partial [Verrucomicrobiales bacterium]